MPTGEDKKTVVNVSTESTTYKTGYEQGYEQGFSKGYYKVIGEKTARFDELTEKCDALSELNLENSERILADEQTIRNLRSSLSIYKGLLRQLATLLDTGI